MTLIAQPSHAFNMARYCLRNASPDPDKVALFVCGADESENESWTYRALETAILRAGYHLRARYGLAARDRVIIRLGDTSAYAIAFFGAISAGLIPVPAAPGLTDRELAYLIEDSEAAAIVLDDRLPHGSLHPGFKIVTAAAFARAIGESACCAYEPTSANDPAFLVYTSGTTASPKGVLHAHRSAWGRRPMYDGWYGIRASDRVLHAGSLNWTYTLGTGLADPWANGATAMVYAGQKTPDGWAEIIRRFDATLFAAVPGVFRQMLKSSGAWFGTLASLRHGLSAGEALPSTVSEHWRDAAGTALYQALGQSELSTYISTSPTVPPKPGTAGKPQAGRRIAVLPEDGGETPLPPGGPGLIAAHRRDPGLMLGYWRRPAEEAAVMRGAWFVGGDAGAMDEDGYVIHLGRRNDLMNAGGFRVSPLEVEAQLAAHPGVQEVGVAEIEVRPGVTVIGAFAVPRDGVPLCTTELAALAGARLAPYKRPRHYAIVPSLPKTANGKVKRGDLKFDPRRVER